jgi:hypothetical protein
MLTKLKKVLFGQGVKGNAIDNNVIDISAKVEPVVQSPLHLSGNVENVKSKEFFIDIEELKKQSADVAKDAVKISVTDGEVILKKVAQLFKQSYKDYQEVYMLPTQAKIKELSSGVDKFSVDQLVEKYKEVIALNLDEIKHFIYTRYLSRFAQEEQGGDVKNEKLNSVEALRKYTIGMTGDENTGVVIQSAKQRRNRIITMFIGVGAIEAFAGFEQFRRAGNTVSAIFTSILVVGLLTFLSEVVGHAFAQRRGYRKAKTTFATNYPAGIDPKNPRGEKLRLLSWPENVESKPRNYAFFHAFAILFIFGMRLFEVLTDKNAGHMMLFGIIVILIANIACTIFVSENSSPHQKEHEEEYQLRLQEVIHHEQRDAKVQGDEDKKRDYQAEYEQDVKKAILAFPEHTISRERQKVFDVLNEITGEREDVLEAVEEMDAKWADLKSAYLVCAAHALTVYRQDPNAPMGHNVQANYSNTENILVSVLNHNKNFLNQTQLDKIKSFQPPATVAFPKFEVNLFEEKKKIEADVNAKRMPVQIQ